MKNNSHRSDAMTPESRTTASPSQSPSLPNGARRPVATYSSYDDAEHVVDSLSEASPLRVLIAGGGVAGLETLMALRGLAGDLVTLTLIAPEDEFVYSPLTVERPFSVGRMRSVGLSRV